MACSEDGVAQFPWDDSRLDLPSRRGSGGVVEVYNALFDAKLVSPVRFEVAGFVERAWSDGSLAGECCGQEVEVVVVGYGVPPLLLRRERDDGG